MSTIQQSDIKLAIEAGLIKRLRILMIAMASSALIYVVVAVFLPPASAAAGANDDPFTGIFGASLAGVAAMIAIMAWLVPNKRLIGTDWAAYFEKGMPQPKGGMLTDRTQIVSQVITAYYMLRLALTEAVAIMGLTFFMYAHFVCGNLEKANPYYYIALAPCPVVAVLILSWMPNEDSLNELFETKMMN